ncbi:hypothetical protein BafPKo_0321 [Borreliella afzelii PKo]|uniref:Lipoprotein n=1 Tax=Borreliella afzelii (strain PKo) TaxID=390236 RepID=G0IRN7_BORAP|nr:hypothetical protein BafPKo_0321 [Borreliella afzelii PKo]
MPKSYNKEKNVFFRCLDNFSISFGSGIFIACYQSFFI